MCVCVYVCIDAGSLCKLPQFNVDRSKMTSFKRVEAKTCVRACVGVSRRTNGE